MTFTNLSRTCALALLGLAGGTARAQTEPAPPPVVDPLAPRWPSSAEDEEERLGRFLEAQRGAELSQYWAVGLGALAVGVPQIALGTYLQGQTNVAAQAIGPGMIVGGAADCIIGFVPLLAPTPMSTLRNFYEAERAAGKPAADVVRDTEDTWRELVVAQRRARFIGGLADLIIGVPPFVTGLVFALAKPGFGGMDSQTQYGWAGALVGFDFLIYEGVIALAAPPPVDTAFDTYQILKHGSAPGIAPKVSVAPVPRGAALQLGVAF
jgi:hypothetical protein